MNTKALNLIEAARETERRRSKIVKGLSFVVVLSKDDQEVGVGPYKTYPEAEGDAKAWDVAPLSAHVMPCFSAKATTADILDYLEPQ